MDQKNEKQKNIYRKLVEARVRLQSKKLSKSGENKFSKYKYFELSDFLPAVNEICAEVGIFAKVEFDDGCAALEIYDTDHPDCEPLRFVTPITYTETKGMHPMQAIGAAQTYARRYLYLAAFEIAESDAIDRSEYNAAQHSSSSPLPRQARTQPRQASKDEAEQDKGHLSKEQLLELYKFAESQHGKDKVESCFKDISTLLKVTSSREWPNDPVGIRECIAGWEAHHD